MKTSKSPESAEVTPSKKTLKQARLPFKLISEVSPVPVTPPSRKRKLSASDAESIPKVGKITKENDIVESLVISDDDSDGTADKVEKKSNPYAKLVDTAIKKKQKTRGKKKRSKKTSPKVNDSECVKKDGENEAMEVDEPADEGKDKAENAKETEIVNNSVDIVVLEDSNSSVDIKKTEYKLLSVDMIPESQDNEAVPKTAETDRNKTNAAEEYKSTDEYPIKTNKDSSTPDVELKTPFTPKRSARNKTKSEENKNKGSPSSSKLNESMTSNPSTPRQTRSSSVTKEESQNCSTPSSNLTPKQLQKKLESAKKREKLEKERQEREKKRQEEKEEKARQRQEKEDQKKREREEKDEAKRKEKEEKEELRKKEREEKEKQKELEKKQREEKEELKRKEKEEKEEQKKKEKEARDEEKRKRQEALELEKHEQEAKKKKAAEAFANFFVPKQKIEKDQPTVGAVNNNMLSRFTIKSDMRLAPTTRVKLTEEKANILETLMKEQSAIESKLYVKSLRNSDSKAKSSGKTWPLCDKDDDVILVEDELLPSDGAGEILTCDLAPREKLRPKLFSFHENRRPPYWGTWRKKSAVVKPRRPFGQDEKQLDYEVDSDDDWEEEAEGESLDGSAAGSDDEQDLNDEYEVDNEVFVPHGYLSDEEATMDEDDVLSLSPETQKARLKHLEDEFESEMKKPTEKLKPRLYGLLWESEDGGKPENCVDSIWNYFGKLSMIMNDPTEFLQPSKEPEEVEKKKIKKKLVKESNGDRSPKEKKKKVKNIEEKEIQPAKTENRKTAEDAKKNQPGINIFLKKKQST